MDGNEQVGVVLVGDAAALPQFHKAVVLTRVNHLDIRKILIDKFSELQRHFQRDVFLVAVLAYGAGVFSTVSGVDDDGGDFLPGGMEGKWR